LAVILQDNDPAGFRLVVNATPLGMSAGDPLPFDPARLGSDTFVGDVVLTAELSPLLKAVARRGCRYQRVLPFTVDCCQRIGCPVARA
jgi:shikimate dehydrogenase